eukprot:1594031-Pyramimonas_sp.AAC.1
MLAVEQQNQLMALELKEERACHKRKQHELEEQSRKIENLTKFIVTDKGAEGQTPKPKKVSLPSRNQIGLDTDTSELRNIKSLSSHLVTQEFNSPTSSLRTTCPCRALKPNLAQLPQNSLNCGLRTRIARKDRRRCCGGRC